jgi:hypothetical protein
MRWTEEALRVILACAVFLGGCGLILLLPVHDRKLPAIFGLPALFFAGWKILHPDAEFGLTPMKGLLLYAGFVIAGTAAAVVIGKFVEPQTSPEVGTIVMLVLFFTSLVVSWIATVFVMDGSLKNFYAEQEQIEAEKQGREYEKRSRGFEG